MPLAIFTFSDMMQKEFAYKVAEIVKDDNNVIGLAAAGSFITNELDEFSDVDLILITKKKVSDDKEKMLGHAVRDVDGIVSLEKKVRCKCD